MSPDTAREQARADGAAAVVKAVEEVNAAIERGERYEHPHVVRTVQMYIEQMATGTEVVLTTGEPKRKVRKYAKALVKRGVPVLVAAQNEYCFWWRDPTAFEMRHTRDQKAMATALDGVDRNQGYLPVRGARRMYGQFHIIRDSIAENPHTETPTLIEVAVAATNLGRLEVKHYGGQVIAELVRRGEAGDAVAGITASLYLNSHALRGKTYPEVMGAVTAIAGEG